MALDDFVDPEVGAAVAATALVLSSRARNLLHRGAVFGVAGALAAGEAVAVFGRGVARGWRAPRVQNAVSIPLGQNAETNGTPGAQHAESPEVSSQ